MFKKTLAFVSTALVAAALVLGSATPAAAYSEGNPPTGNEANQAVNWQWETGETCVKDDKGLTTETYTVVAPAPDRVYSKIILKSGDDNLVFNDPVAGAIISTTNGHDVSHIVFCTLPKPTPQDATAAISITPATCEAPAQLVLGTVEHASWGPVTGAYSVTATATTGHLFADDATPGVTVSEDGTTKTFAGTLDPQLSGYPCAVPVVKPQHTKIDECGVYGSITATDTALVDYTITPNDGQDAGLTNMHGSYTVTAVAISPAILDGSYPVGGWTIDLGAYEDCYEPKVSVEVGGCYPDRETSYKNVTFVFDNEESTTDVTFTVPSAIDALSPLEPRPYITITVPAGETAKVVTDPVSKNGASFAVYADGDLIDTVTVDSFVGCINSIPGDPQVTPAGCVAGVQTDGSIWVDLSPGLVYMITGTDPGSAVLISPVVVADNPVPAGKYSVSVVAEPGHILGGDTVWPYAVTVNPPVECIKPFAKADLDTVLATCVFDGSIDNASIVLEHAKWVGALPTAPGAYTVTATADEGYTFDGTATTKSIEITIGAAANTQGCNPTLGQILPTFSATPFTCSANGSYTLGVDPNFDPTHITWTVNGVPNVASGTYAVTSSQVLSVVAVPVAPNGLANEWKDPAPISFVKPSLASCGDLTTLALTSGAFSLGVQTLVGGALFLAVGGVLIIRRRAQAE